VQQFLDSLRLSVFFLVPQNSVLPYLFSDDYRIRKEAATTCARMLVASIHRNSTKGPSAAAIEDILSRLLEVVVSDTSPQVSCPYDCC
jgi:hypothetical protein